MEVCKVKYSIKNLTLKIYTRISSKVLSTYSMDNEHEEKDNMSWLTNEENSYALGFKCIDGNLYYYMFRCMYGYNNSRDNNIFK